VASSLLTGLDPLGLSIIKFSSFGVTTCLSVMASRS
jgi:hypothetical protein